MLLCPRSLKLAFFEHFNHHVKSTSFVDPRSHSLASFNNSKPYLEMTRESTPRHCDTFESFPVDEWEDDAKYAGIHLSSAGNVSPVSNDIDVESSQWRMPVVSDDDATAEIT